MTTLDLIRREVARAVALVQLMLRRAVLSSGVSSSYEVQAAGAGDDGWDGVEFWQSYGLASRPPSGGEVLFAESYGTGEGAIAIATNDRSHRPSDLSEGDVVIYGKKGTGQPRVTLAADGKVTITSGGATPGTVVLKADGSIQATPGTGKTIDIAGATDFQLLGSSFTTKMTTLFGVLSALVPAIDPASAAHTNGVAAALIAFATAPTTLLSTKAKVG